MAASLSELRKQLDQTDRKLVHALSERMRIVTQVAKLKAKDSLRLRDVTREEELLTKLIGYGRAARVDSHLVTRVFHEILDYSVRIQQSFLQEQLMGAASPQSATVAFHGTEGSYSYLAAERAFGAQKKHVLYQGFDTFARVLDALDRDEADFAVIPIENTTAGSINEVYDLLSKKNLAFVAEEILPIDHCLVATQKVSLAQIQRIYSHPQAIAQCSNFLATIRHVHIESFVDSVMAAKKVAVDRDPRQAAIASQEAAQRYKLHILQRGIANQRNNFTRFVVVAKTALPHDLRVPCKTSLLFATGHEQGALLGCLNVFAAHGLNLSKLESRPRPNTPWEYLFYVDFEGNVADPKVQDALKELSAKTSFLKLFGSYPSRTARAARPAQPRANHGALPAASHKKRSASSLPKGKARAGASQTGLLSRKVRSADTQFEVKHVLIGGPTPVWVVGVALPSTQRELERCVHVLKEHGVHMVWWARSSQAAPVDKLAELSRRLELPFIADVTQPAEIEKRAVFADVLRVGAAHMHNGPLLHALGHMDRPVLLERAPTASLKEWLAAAEQILQGGNRRVILCDGGVRTLEEPHHNALDLASLAQVRYQSHLPLFVSLSADTSNAPWLSGMAQAALHLGVHGLSVDLSNHKLTRTSLRGFGHTLASLGTLLLPPHQVPS